MYDDLYFVLLVPGVPEYVIFPGCDIRKCLDMAAHEVGKLDKLSKKRASRILEGNLECFVKGSTGIEYCILAGYKDGYTRLALLYKGKMG